MRVALWNYTVEYRDHESRNRVGVDIGEDSLFDAVLDDLYELSGEQFVRLSECLAEAGFWTAAASRRTNEYGVLGWRFDAVGNVEMRLAIVLMTCLGSTVARSENAVKP